jgi:lipoprotein-anchoring transpeptidase ErfK/SrfK
MTPEGGPNLVLALASRRDVYGRAWVRVRLAILPNNSTGWILRDALGELHLVRTRLVVERAQLRIVLWRNGRVLFRARAGVGQARWPTPSGEFYVREKLAGFNDPFYGPIAFGTSARSAVLTDWPGGGYVGIHGTNQPNLLPGRVSHGCIRLRNVDIRRLAQLLPLGTPVSVR